mmetsp:Transcript_20603/g.25474  ORF Transcript_20603/g.25474 Transcript_20603/m.25474 type:complete len:214 (+) Transcript_20603:589-1230(+)
MDHKTVRRVFHSRRIKRILPPKPRGRTTRSLRSLRPAHAPGLRLGPQTRLRRRRHGRSPHRLRRRHETTLRRHTTVRRQRQHDNERRRTTHIRNVHRRRGRTSSGRSRHRTQQQNQTTPSRRRRQRRRRAQVTPRNDPKRHFKRIPRPKHIHLPPHTEHDTHRRGYYGLHFPRHATVQLHQRLGLSHARGRRRRSARTRVYHRGRVGILARGA